MSKDHKPQKGDKVNDQRRFQDGREANGFVTHILYGDDGPEEIIVRFDDGADLYDYSEFQYSWTDALGGVFQLT